MKIAHHTVTLVAVNVAMMVCLGCQSMPGYPTATKEATRPSEVLDFKTLYAQNCSGCHGENGRGGAAIALNNPAYLAVAGAETVHAATAQGMHGTLMPAFARSSNGMLTDEQVDALVHGILQNWGNPAEFAGIKLPLYASSGSGDAAAGEEAYLTACARCHGADGSGVHAGHEGAMQHSIVDPSYLALVSDQSLRSVVIAGHPEERALDWRTYIAGHPLTDQEIGDIVAWLGKHRSAIDEPQANPIPLTPVPAKTGKEGP